MPFMKPNGHSSREIIKIIENDGWFLYDADGSHKHFKHETKKGKVTIVHPKKDIPVKTFESVMQQAGIDYKTL
jgi:predicted RNA binding protein YcfA (HicA-like mRNA interferase family)